MEQNFLNEYRCDCGKLLFKGTLVDCKIEIKCKRCGEIKLINFIGGNKTEDKKNQTNEI